MTLTIRTPAPIADLRLCACYAQEADWMLWTKLVIQWCAFPSWGFYYREPSPLACGGIQQGATREAWFVAGPGADQHMLPLIRAFRQILLADLARTPGTITTVARTPEGQRIAQAIGFREHDGQWRIAA